MSPPQEAHEAQQPQANSLTGLQDIVRALRSSRRFIDILEMTGEQARLALSADSLSLSEWDRDRGRLVTRVNLGRLAPGEHRFPEDEVYELAREAALLLEGTGFIVQAGDPDAPEPDHTILVTAEMASGITIPVSSEGRLWGELWATRSAKRPPYADSELPFARAVAELVGEVVTSGQLLERTARMAFEDPLTRLANRRVFDDRLTELLAEGQDGATVVLCDLDGLKAINDAEGHGAGDRVITLAADSLSVVASRAGGCIAARIGGDEFALVLPGDQRAKAVSVVQRAAALLQRGSRGASMSCGVAAAPAGTPARVLVATADAALYGAKRRGAQLLLSSNLSESEHEILAARPLPTHAIRADDEWRGGADDVPVGSFGGPRRRRWDDATDRPYAGDAAAAVAEATQALAERLTDLPRDLPAALRWVGDTLLGPLDLDRWVLGAIRPGANGKVVQLDSLGMRHARLGADIGPEEEDIAAEIHPIEDFPAAMVSMQDGSVFGFELNPTDPHVSRPSEITAEILRRMGMRFVVGASAHDEESGEWLITVFGASDHVPVAAVREVMVLALAAATRQDEHRE